MRLIVANLVVAAILGAAPVQAEGERAICKSETPNRKVKITLGRIGKDDCPTASGKEGDVDYVFCANLQYEYSQKSSAFSSNFMVNCYKHTFDKGVSVSCVGFNGPFSTFSMYVNRDETFTSSMLYAQMSDKEQNISSIDTGACVDA